MKEQIISFININGPSLPTQIAKSLSADSLFVSAHLSEMKEQGKMKISNLKVGGGSPLYYLSGQEGLLVRFADNLGEKEKKVYDLLFSKKVLRDSSLVPVFRAAIRTIKDFAFPFTVNYQGKKELFWKWYMLSKEDTNVILRKVLGIKEKVVSKVEEDVVKKDVVEDNIKKEATKEGVEKQVQREKVVEKEEITKEKVERREEKQEKEERQEKLAKVEKIESEFYDELISYFSKNNITVVETDVIRKKSEIDFIVEVPSSVGKLQYYVKAKSKKKVNDGDLSSVFIKAQSRRLPVLFLSKGDLTKKAKEMLDTEFKGMRFNKI